MNQRNKDLPASAVHPIQDKFGQVILMTGFTKQEAVALQILSAQIIMNQQLQFPTKMQHLIEESYSAAEQFCSYLENKSEKESGLIQSV